jgi:NAD(P)-dependent dehydrogenase (short-subunit alcohol dehydrogenase family)
MSHIHKFQSASANAAILGFFAEERGPHGITVNAISPSAAAHENPIVSFQAPNASAEMNDTLRKVLCSYPIGKGLGCLTKPEDAADTVAFLASARVKRLYSTSIHIRKSLHVLMVTTIQKVRMPRGTSTYRRSNIGDNDGVERHSS